MEISDWLHGIGLGRYAQAFADNEVRVDVLPQLTSQDLKEIGVLPVGDRHRILAAIAALDRGAAPAEEGRPSAGAEPSLYTKGERRQLTVMFVDLVASTELSHRLDPEDLARLIRSYQTCCTETVTGWGGHVAKYMGDGVLVYFGYPTAHEDDAERAVRAGLGVAAAVATLKDERGEPLSARLGIATGLVMVGELIGDHAAQEQTVVGETLNLAARLQGAAAPGSVVISASTRRLIGELFDVDDLGEQILKGFDRPVRAWRVRGESRYDSRFEATRGGRLSQLVGRDSELGLLLSLWERAQGREGQVVLLSGEAGFGKSRIVHALQSRIAQQPQITLNHFCSPYHTNSALHPVVGMIERAAGFTREAPVEVKLAKLQAMLAARTENVTEAMSRISELLGLPVGVRDPPFTVTPQMKARRTLEILVEQVEVLARSQPVLAVYEDVHWIDPTSLGLLEILVGRVRHMRCLVVITYRPEFQPSWSEYPHVSQIPIAPLSRDGGEELIMAATGGKPLPKEVRDEILRRTDGVPLFVEELTKTILESGIVTDAGDHFELVAPLTAFAIPATLHDSLMARLDRLANVKQVAQIAAVIGRNFAYDLLAIVQPLSEAELLDALDRLVAAEMIFQEGDHPNAKFIFKHALVRDAAYQSMLKTRRQQLHARVAHALVAKFPEVFNAEPEVVALHQTEAGMLREAIESWRRAGIMAIRRSAFKEAVQQLTTGLKLLDQLPDGPDPGLELALRTHLGPALIATRGFSVAEVGESYARAHTLSRTVGEISDQFSTLWGLWVFHTVRAELRCANDLGYQLLKLARTADNDDLMLQAHHALETSLFWSGRFPEALQHMRAGIALYEPARHQGHAGTYGGHDPGTCCLAFQSLALWICGHFDQAVESADQALAVCEEIQQPRSLAHAQQLLFRLDILRGDAVTLAPKAKALVSLSVKHGFESPRAVATMALGWALAKLGNVESGIAHFREGIELHERNGGRVGQTLLYGLLAEILHGIGQTEVGDEFLRIAFKDIDETEERFSEAELWTVRARAAARQGGRHLAEAESCFQKAIAVAVQQRAKTWELRAATGFARLLADRGDRRGACHLLSPVVHWFHTDLDIADLRDAKALLDTLA